MLRKGVIGEALDGDTAEFSNTDTTAEGLSKRFPTWGLFISPFATFLRHKTEEKNYSIAFAWKQLLNTVHIFNDESESMLSCSDSVSDEVLPRKSLKCCLKRCHRKGKNKDVNWHPILVRVVEEEAKRSFRNGVEG